MRLAGYRAKCGTPVKPQSPSIIQVSALPPFKDLLDAEARRRVCGDVPREADVWAEVGGALRIGDSDVGPSSSIAMHATPLDHVAWIRYEPWWRSSL